MNRLHLCLVFIAIFGLEVKGNPIITTDRFFGNQNFNRHQSFEPSFQSDEVDFVFIPIDRSAFEPFQFNGNQEVIFIPSLENFDFNRQNSRRNFAWSNLINNQNVAFNDRHQFNRDLVGQSPTLNSRLVESNLLNRHNVAEDNRPQGNRDFAKQPPIKNNFADSNFNKQDTVVADRHQFNIDFVVQSPTLNSRLVESNLVNRQNIIDDDRRQINRDFSRQGQNSRIFVESNINKKNVFQDSQQFKRNFNDQDSIVIQERVPIIQPNVVKSNQPSIEETRSNLLLRNIINGIKKDIFSNNESNKKEIKRERLPKQELNSDKLFIDKTHVQEINLVPSQSQTIEVRSKFENPNEKLSRSNILLNGIIGGIRKDIFPKDNLNKEIVSRINPIPITQNFVHQENDIQQASSNMNRLTKQRLLVPMRDLSNGQVSRSQLLLGGIINGIQKDIFNDKNNRRISFN